MRCKKCKENIVLYLYGDLSENEKLELEAHVKECTECTKELSESKQVFGLIEDAGAETVPEANWDRNWAKINATIQEKPSKQRSFLLVSRWAYATAAVLLIFILGIFTGRTWERRTIQLEAGDVLVLYTDGVTEAQDREGTFFGERRLLALAQSQPTRSAREIQAALMSGIRAFVDGAPQFDDIALLVLVREA